MRRTITNDYRESSVRFTEHALVVAKRKAAATPEQLAARHKRTLRRACINHGSFFTAIQESKRKLQWLKAKAKLASPESKSSISLEKRLQMLAILERV